MDDWISVEERLPEEFDDVLILRCPNHERTFVESGWYIKPVYHESGELAFSERWESRMRMEIEGWNDMSDYFNGRQRDVPPVTHWMPLPDPPKEATDGS